VVAGGSYGFGNADTLRRISFTGFSDTTSASYDANTAQMFVEAGYEVALDNITLQPFAGLAWSQVSADAFRESGGAAALSGTARTMDTGYSLLGLQFATPFFDLADGKLTASFRAAWQHSFTATVASRGLAFLATGQGFTVLGTPLDEDRALIDAGFTLGLGANTSVSFGYNGALGNQANDHGVKLLLNARL